MDDGGTGASAGCAERNVIRYVANPDIIDCPLGDGLAVFDSGSGVYFNFNRTAALIWDRVRTSATRSDLHALLIGAASPSAASHDVERDLDALLQDLLIAGLMIQLPENAVASAES